jgi:D-alanyl-D-alanine carboxypeptidase
MKELMLSLFSLLIGMTLNAQQFDKSRMDSLFQLIEANDKGMGSIAILANGKTVYQNAIGYASMAEKEKATPTTTYRIGSISKTFTATLILQLVEEGQLSLDTKLSEYFPKVKNAEQITIEHLLRHRSGIFNITDGDDYLTWMESPQTREQMVSRIVEAGSIFEPGTQAAYSNSNYILLTYIAEQLYGQTFNEALQDKICKPCGLTSTYVGGKLNVAEGETYSYTKLDGWELSTETDMSVPSGAGALMSTPDELNRFLHCLFSEKLINTTSLEAMTKMVDGLGLGVFPYLFTTNRPLAIPVGLMASSPMHFTSRRTR